MISALNVTVRVVSYAQMELDIMLLAKETGEGSIAESFLEYSQARKRAINSIFWNEKMGQWLDYWITNDTACQVPCSCKCCLNYIYSCDIFSISFPIYMFCYVQESQTWKACNQNQNMFASNFSPLWITLFNSG